MLASKGAIGETTKSLNAAHRMGILLVVAFVLFALITGPTVALAENRIANANVCLVWTSESLLANAYFQVTKNDCAYPIQIEYRYEEDVGAGCFGPSPCTALLQPHEIRRFTAGTIRYWACRPPAVPRLPEITHGICE
jgi:hypothetical protein